MNTLNNTIVDNINILFKCFFYYASTRLVLYFLTQNPRYITLLKRKIDTMIDFYIFICENNPLLIDYLDGEILEDLKITNMEPEKYEEKYVTKYKSFPNVFSFTEEEIGLETEKYIELKTDFETQKESQIIDFQSKITTINKIFMNGINTEKGLNGLLEFYTIEDEYDDDPESIDLNEYLNDLNVELSIYENNLKELENKVVIDNEFKNLAKEYIINFKLDKLINNYVTEYTPLGNVHMRYNNVKNSFEYFSNNAIPYRYLETVGRKYVTTYWCKPIFVDIEEELQKSEVKFDNELKQRKNEEDKRKNEPIDPKKRCVVKFKNYNTNTHHKNQNISGRPSQPRNVNKSSGKQLLKEKSNRYSCEGRFSDCPFLQKIDKNVTDKNYSMSFADFKRIQQDNQNKK